jgi:hypothetical protein
LRFTQALLLGLVLVLSLVGRGSDLWPIRTWPVYGTVRPRVPGPTYSTLEVRARTPGGRTYTLRSEDLVEMSRSRIADLAIDGAVHDPRDRVYLARLVQRAIGAAVDFIEIWKIEWRVDVRAVPPLDAGRPSSERRLAGFPGSLE